MDNNHNSDIAQKIRDGSYFEDGKKWYDLIYISPISERIYFIIVTIFSIIIFLMALISLYNLLPIVPREAFVYNSGDIVKETPDIIKLRTGDETPDEAIIKFYLEQYVKRRESYSEKDFKTNVYFIRNYSKHNIFSSYYHSVNPDNSRSPVRKLGRGGKIAINITNITHEFVKKSNNAVINFDKEIITSSGRIKSNWTATIKLDYKGIELEEAYDEDKGKYYLATTKNPLFKVNKYDVVENLPKLRK